MAIRDTRPPPPAGRRRSLIERHLEITSVPAQGTRATLPVNSG
jgi:hypothetical protein